MSQKTPKFQAELDRYFDNLVLDQNGGQERVCRLSGKKFYIRREDIDFYKKIGVALPTLCLDERLRRKFAFSSSGLFYNISDFTGKKIVSMYLPNKEIKVYEHNIWFSDQWDPMEYGVDFNIEGSFFDQYKELNWRVPKFALFTDETNENSDYTNNSVRLKNCYLVFNSLDGEDCYYTRTLLNSKNCFGGALLFNCDTCYECAQAYDSYQCFFGEDIKNCRDSYFLFDCRGCSDCFLCSNLRNRQYCFNNKQLSKEEYFKQIEKIDLGSWKVMQEFKEKFEILKSKSFYRQNHNENSVDVDGDYVLNSKNVYRSFYILNSENIAYSSGFAGYRDSFDTLGGGGGELCYEIVTVSTEGNYRVLFSMFVNHSTNMEYCDSCFNCHDCFGCVGLRYKSFCIGNKQYSELEYWQELDRIKTGMLARGEYGEFFSPMLSAYSYELTDAFVYGPGAGKLDEAKKYGYRFIQNNVADIESNLGQGDQIFVENIDLPDNIRDVDENILGKIVIDQKNSKQFKYVAQEFVYHKKYNLALPREHPAFRRQKIMSSVLSLGFWIYDDYERKCSRCQKEIISVHKSDFAGLVLCFDCYENQLK